MVAASFWVGCRDRVDDRKGANNPLKTNHGPNSNRAGMGPSKASMAPEDGFFCVSPRHVSAL